jgi:hypothetical protein
MSEVPTGKELRVDSAIPYASQIMNDSTYPGKYVDDALDGVYTTIGCRLRTVIEDLDLVLVGLDEKSAALGGSASDYWHPTFAVVKLKSTTGSAPATPAQISIGTASAGTQLVAATALTGLDTAGDTLIISFTGAKAAITADSTIYVNVTTAEGTATTAVADVYVYGEIL